MKRIVCLLIAFVILSLPSVYAREEEDFLSVTDGASILSEEVERYIYTKNKLLDEKTGARIIIATATDTGELSVNEYARELHKNLGVSGIGRNNGVFVFICSSDKDYTLIVSPGINAALTDSYAQKCLVEYMEADFENGNYDEAVVKTFNAFGRWYNDTYDTDISFTEDMTEYKSIIRNEKQRKSIRRVAVVSIWVIVIGVLFTLIIRYRRNKRMEKLRKKRQERRKRYMEIKRDEV